MANFANYGNLETILTGYANKINGIKERSTIEGDGTAVTDRDTLNFKDMSVSDDSTNEKTDVKPHRLTPAELADIMSPLPSAFDMSNVSVDAYNFSTSEKVIGTWIDGKPLYQKTIDCGALPNNTTKHIDTGLNKADVTIVSIDGLSKYDNQYASLPYISSSASWNIITEANDNGGTSKIYLQVTTTANWSNGSATMTLRYTKTTDVAVSSGEKIVGQWTDGKAIFEKIYDLGTAISVSPTTWTSTGINISNVSDIIECNGIASSLSCPLIATKAGDNTLKLVTSRNENTSVLYVTLRYTKV